MPDQLHVVYSAATGRIRSVVVPSLPGERIVCNLNPGEAVALMDITLAKQDLNALQAALNAVTKLTPANDRYAVVDQLGNVRHAIIADPLCGDSVAGCDLVPHHSAGPGWKRIAGILTAPVPNSLGPAKIIPAGVA